MILITPIRLKTSVGSISPGTERFLRKLSSFLDDKSSDTHKTADIIAISNPRDIEGADFVAALEQRINEYPDAHVLVLDMGGPNAERIPSHRVIYALIVAITNIRAENPDLHIILTLPKIIHKKDHYYQIFKKIILDDEEMTLFVYSSQQVYGRNQDIAFKRGVSELISTWQERAKSDLQTQLKSKLVCHIGNYVISDTGKRVHDFYDGSFAGEFIYSLLKELIDDLLKERDGILTVIYDDTVSNWFSAPVRTLILQHYEERIALHSLSELRNSSLRVSADVILAPICRSGDTFRRIIREHYSNKEEQSELRPYLWALISATEEVPLDGTLDLGIVRCSDHEIPIRVAFSIEVGDRGQRLASVWEKLDLIPVSSSEITEKLSAQLSADEMWGMVYEAGLSDESDVPDWREAIDKVPNFLRLIDLNGPLIAAKVNAVLENLSDKVSSTNFAFIYPDEPAARLLAEALYGLSEHESIAISKDLIGLAANAGSRESIKRRASEKSTDLLTAISSELERLSVNYSQRDFNTQRPMKVIGITEFSTTGSSIEGIYRLSRMMNWQLIADISIAEIPLGPRYQIRRHPMHSLYKFGDAVIGT